MKKNIKNLFLVIFFILLNLLSNYSLSQAAELPFLLSGSFKSKYIYELENKNHGDKTNFNLEIEKSLSNSAAFYLEFDFESYSQYLQNKKYRENELSLKEGYFDYYTKNIDWRAGKQILNWGSSYNIKPSNYFNPIELGAINPLENREAIDLIQAKYYLKNNKQLTAAAGIRDNIDDSQLALKFTKRRWQGFDLSFSVFQGEQLEAFKLNNYPKVNKIGFDLIGDIGPKNIGLFSELVYSNFKKEIFNDSYEAVIGFDYKFQNNLYLLGQFYYQEKLMRNLKDKKIISIHGSRPFLQFHSWEFNLLYELDSKLLIFRPKVFYSLTEALELEMGAVLKSNSDSQNRLNNLNQELIYIGLNSYF